MYKGCEKVESSKVKWPKWQNPLNNSAAFWNSDYWIYRGLPEHRVVDAQDASVPANHTPERMHNFCVIVGNED